MKAQCATYNTCTPDPTCYLFVAPTSKCLELTSGVTLTYFSAFSYLSVKAVTLLYGGTYTCSILSQSATCLSFGLSFSAGEIIATPSITNSPS